MKPPSYHQFTPERGAGVLGRGVSRRGVLKLLGLTVTSAVAAELLTGCNTGGGRPETGSRPKSADFAAEKRPLDPRLIADRHLLDGFADARALAGRILQGRLSTAIDLATRVQALLYHSGPLPNGFQKLDVERTQGAEIYVVMGPADAGTGDQHLFYDYKTLAAAPDSEPQAGQEPYLASVTVTRQPEVTADPAQVGSRNQFTLLFQTSPNSTPDKPLAECRLAVNTNSQWPGPQPYEGLATTVEQLQARLDWETNLYTSVLGGLPAVNE